MIFIGIKITLNELLRLILDHEIDDIRQCINNVINDLCFHDDISFSLLHYIV